MENEGLINAIMTNIGMAIPLGLTDNIWLKDFEERLPDCLKLWNFVKNTNVGQIIKEQDCIEVFTYVRGIETEVQGRMTLSRGEIWILEFLKKVNESDFVSFIKIVGPLYYAVRIASDIKEVHEDLTNNIKAALFIYLFQNLYELVLGTIDACFYVYLDKKEVVKGLEYTNRYRKEFIDKRKEARRIKGDKGEHASAGLIYGMLKEVYKEECENNHTFMDSTFLNDTIFNQMAEKLRNSSAHFNAFYDEKRDKIVFLNGDEITMEELIALYDKLFLFLATWMNLYLSEAKDDKAFADKIKEEMQKMVDRTEKMLHEIVRSGRQNDWNGVVRHVLGNSIVKFEKKEKSEDNKHELQPVNK